MVYKPFAGVRCICPAVEDIGHVCNAKQGIKEPAQLLLATSVADSGALGLTTAPPLIPLFLFFVSSLTGLQTASSGVNCQERDKMMSAEKELVKLRVCARSKTQPCCRSPRLVTETFSEKREPPVITIGAPKMRSLLCNYVTVILAASAPIKEGKSFAFALT